jgi:hypothetical protein
MKVRLLTMMMKINRNMRTKNIKEFTSPKKQNSTKQLVKTILEESPLKLSTPEVIRKRRAVQRAGVVGRRTGAMNRCYR